MTSRERLLAAWSFRAPDRVPIEIDISPEAKTYPEAVRVLSFIRDEADDFIGVPGIDWGFAGLDAAYREEVLSETSEHVRRKRVYATEAGDFTAITLHRKDEVIGSDFHWERRYVHDLSDLERMAEAVRRRRPTDGTAFAEAGRRIGERGLPQVGVWHPLGWLVRHATMEEVYIWMAQEKRTVHRFLSNANAQVADTVAAAIREGIGPVFGVTAHEMLIPPWMGMAAFDEMVTPYDTAVNAAVHAGGGRVRAHCHGNCGAYLEKFSSIGIDSLEPLEGPPFGDVDLAEAKRRVGDRMLLSGNVASNLFPMMSDAEVRRAVRDAIRDGAAGGGFTLRTTGGHAGTNAAKSREQMVLILRRIETYIDAGLEYGRL
jgi:hypothetical protein